ncbi:hypothetical protein G6F42_016929 [Rhizopus arrhizus]|nr:hypothetical protein G6F42_016929 [Rhizopus arrhizus]
MATWKYRPLKHHRSGSGCVTTLLAKIVGNTNAVFLTTDINEFACETTRQTGLHNGITQIEPIRTSLVNGIMPRLKNRIDILCFNPPYVVTTHEEVGSLGIEASWAGGIDGREDILSPAGIFYLLLINENKPDQVVQLMKESYGMNAKIVMERRAGREKQFIVKITH